MNDGSDGIQTGRARDLKPRTLEGFAQWTRPMIRRLGGNMNNICQICEESVASGVMCDDGVYRCIGCAMEDGFDIQTGLPVEIAA